MIEYVHCRVLRLTGLISAGSNPAVTVCLFGLAFFLGLSALRYFGSERPHTRGEKEVPMEKTEITRSVPLTHALQSMASTAWAIGIAWAAGALSGEAPN